MAEDVPEHLRAWFHPPTGDEEPEEDNPALNLVAGRGAAGLVPRVIAGGRAAGRWVGWDVGQVQG